MSTDHAITAYTTDAGKRWKVAYYDTDGKQQLKQGFATEADAEAWWATKDTEGA